MVRRPKHAVKLQPGAVVVYRWGLDNESRGRVVKVYGPDEREHVIVEDEHTTRSIRTRDVVREAEPA